MLGRCVGCNAPIEWADIDGKRYALDTRAHTYEWKDTGDPYTSGYVRSRGMVVHTIICPNKERFERQRYGDKQS